MNRILFFLLAMVSASMKGQTLEVNYNLQIDISGALAQPFNHQYLLTNSNQRSVQKKFLAAPASDKVADKNNQSSRIVKIGNDTTYVYKDFAHNRLFSEEKIFTKVFNVTDELDIFSWRIEEDTLTILNHKCRKATTMFRGREFAAYFAEDIPIPDGPAKFNGLPGLILKVEIVNSTTIFLVEAVKIRFEKATKEVHNPFDSKKTMAFKDFKKEYNAKYSEMQSFSASQSGNFTVYKGGLELLSDD